MYSRKSAGSRMEPCGTPELTGNSFEYRTRTTWSLLKNTLSKALNISSVTAQVAPGLLKTLAILSDTTVRRSTVDWEDLNPHWKLEKRSHLSRWSTILLFTSFSKTLLTTERRLIWKTRLLQTIIEEFS